MRCHATQCQPVDSAREHRSADKAKTVVSVSLMVELRQGLRNGGLRNGDGTPKRGTGTPKRGRD
jgi:hypothetical protein